MSPARRILFVVGFSALELLVPWGWLLWAMRPGAPRPPLGEIVGMFWLANIPVVQYWAGHAVRERRLAFAAYGYGASLISFGLLALRLGDGIVFPILAGLTLGFALLIAGIERLLFRRGEPKAETA